MLKVSPDFRWLAYHLKVVERIGPYLAPSPPTVAGSWLRSIDYGLRLPGPGRPERRQELRRFLQVRRVVAFGEPQIDAFKELVCVARTTLATPQAREADRGTQLPGSGVLLTCDRECAQEANFRLAQIT